MKRYRVFAVTTFALLSLVSVLAALSGAIDASKPFDDKGTPKGIRDVVNSVPRVHAWGGRMEPTGYRTFYYKGKTEVLNQLLERLSKLPLETNDLKVTLIPAPGNKGEWFEDKPFDFNWSITISGYPDDAPTSWNVVVNIYVNGDVDVEKLKLPFSFDANVGGKVAGFVSTHNDRRKNLAKQLLTKHLDASSQPAKAGLQMDTRPTSFKGAGYEGGGIFPIEPTTEPSSKPAE